MKMFCPPWQQMVYEIRDRTYRYDRTEDVHPDDVDKLRALGWLEAESRTMMRPPPFTYSTQAPTKTYFARDGEQPVSPADTPALLRDGWEFLTEGE